MMQFEVSVVIPCLNEQDTLGACLEKASQALREHRISGEIIVADNGSTDRSVEIAQSLGATVVFVPRRGYGEALKGGIRAAQGKFIIMGDADESYDFLEIPKFVEKLREGADLVQGCRLPAGGGSIEPGAMPWSHRWIGNPMFTWMAQRWFRAPIHDVYCGLRGFTKKHFEHLELRCSGMEFATEMVIKSSLQGARIAEVPITLHRDKRISHAPHLKTMRDGWRTLRFFLLYSPTWLFLIPGLLLIFLGLVGYGLALPGVTLFGATFDAHTLLFASLSLICGYQACLFSIFTKTFAVSERLLPPDPWLERYGQWLSLEKTLIISALILLGGAFLLLWAVNQWRMVHFGSLDYPRTMRLVVPGAMLTVVGFQTMFAGFFVSILKLPKS